MIYSDVRYRCAQKPLLVLTQSPLFLSDLNQIWNVQTNRSKTSQYQTSREIVLEEIGRKDRHGIDNVPSFAILVEKTPKEDRTSLIAY
jgi:hypothetical protein